MAESLVYTFELPVYPERVYRAWLSGGEQARITGAPARVDARVDGVFSLFEGKLSGTFLTLTPTDRIVFRVEQMTDFPGAAGEVEITLESTCTGAEVKLRQNGIPSGKTGEMIAWWEQNVVRPYRRYFDEIVGEYVADMGDG